jgi:Ankyrin repeats (3 copies)
MPVCDIVLKDVRRGARTTPCDQRTTLMSAAFQSSSRLELAAQCGLQLSGDTGRLQYIARLYADVSVLSLAEKHGVPLSYGAGSGAVESGRVNVVDFLIQEQHCELPGDADCYAARAGDVDMLQCLRRKQVCVFTWYTCSSAASAGHLRALKYLWSAARCIGALQGVAHCPLCHWKHDSSLADAAKSGSIEMVQWLLQQQGVALSMSAMQAAACAGHTRMCEYLHSQHCPWPATVCADAAADGRLDTVRWLYEHGYFYNANNVLKAAAESGAVDIMEYLLLQGVALSTAQLTDMLITACQRDKLAAAQWLRK